MTSSYLRKMVSKSMQKPLKLDIRSVCEYHLYGPVTRTFLLPRKELVALLSKKENEDIVDRVDITEYDDESRLTMYSMSRMENRAVDPLSKVSTNTTEWDLDPQYDEYSARGFRSGF